MSKVDTAQLADILGKTDNAAFQHQVDTAIADLERVLGYPLCGATPDFEERVYKYYPGYLWQKTAPFYESESLTIVRNGVEDVIANEDTQVGKNGSITATDWANGIKLCKRCDTASACQHFADCDYIKVSAKWGFCPPTEVDNSDADPTYYCCLPADLYNVIVEAVRQGTDPKSDIQSENVGTRSYSKFTKAFASVFEKYADVIEYYRLREPRL